jgi:DICT domain-containing protein
MGEPKTATAPVDSQHYREVAEKLRKIARQSRSPEAQQKILNFASRYDGTADHLDKRGAASGSGQDPG